MCVSFCPPRLEGLLLWFVHALRIPLIFSTCAQGWVGNYCTSGGAIDAAVSLVHMMPLKCGQEKWVRLVHGNPAFMMIASCLHIPLTSLQAGTGLKA